MSKYYTLDLPEPETPSLILWTHQWRSSNRLENYLNSRLCFSSLTKYFPWWSVFVLTTRLQDELSYLLQMKTSTKTKPRCPGKTSTLPPGKLGASWLGFDDEAAADTSAPIPSTRLPALKTKACLASDSRSAGFLSSKRQLQMANADTSVLHLHVQWGGMSAGRPSGFHTKLEIQTTIVFLHSLKLTGITKKTEA